MPHREVLDGVLVIFGGAFLITPGFLTDIVGLTLLLPPTRAIVAALPCRAALGRRVVAGGRTRPTTTWRAARASTTSRAGRGSSRERSGARAVLLRRGPRHSRDVAGGRDDPVRGPQAARAPARARRSSRAARAGAPSCRTGSRSSSSRWRPRQTSVASAHGSCGCAARRPGAQVDCLGDAVRDRRAAALGGARCHPHHLGPGGRAARPAGDRAAPARRRRARRRGGDARLVEDDAVLTVEDARISTVYDGGGRQRSAGLELWVPGEDYPRRGSGQVIAGSSLDLEGLQVHVAVFRWRLDGREGIGAYELMSRTEPPAAA